MNSLTAFLIEHHQHLFKQISWKTHRHLITNFSISLHFTLPLWYQFIYCISSSPSLINQKTYNTAITLPTFTYSPQKTISLREIIIREKEKKKIHAKYLGQKQLIQSKVEVINITNEKNVKEKVNIVIISPKINTVNHIFFFHSSPSLSVNYFNGETNIQKKKKIVSYV